MFLFNFLFIVFGQILFKRYSQLGRDFCQSFQQPALIYSYLSIDLFLSISLI